MSPGLQLQRVGAEPHWGLPADLQTRPRPGACSGPVWRSVFVLRLPGLASPLATRAGCVSLGDSPAFSVPQLPCLSDEFMTPTFQRCWDSVAHVGAHSHLQLCHCWDLPSAGLFWGKSHIHTPVQGTLGTVSEAVSSPFYRRETEARRG